MTVCHTISDSTRFSLRPANLILVKSASQSESLDYQSVNIQLGESIGLSHLWISYSHKMSESSRINFLYRVINLSINKSRSSYSYVSEWYFGIMWNNQKPNPIVFILKGAEQFDEPKNTWKASEKKVHIRLIWAFVVYFNILWTISNIKKEKNEGSYLSF